MNIKRFLKNLFPQYVVRYVASVHSAFASRGDMSFISFIKRVKIIDYDDRHSYSKCYAIQFEKMCKCVEFDSLFGYIYPCDFLKIRVIPQDCKRLLSITADFDRILKCSLSDIEREVNNCSNEEFKSIELSIIKSIHLLASRIGCKKPNGSREEKLIALFPSLLDDEPKSFDAALQKILFYNALFWQMGHRHIGLGRLDKILYPYFKKDIDSHIMTVQEASKMLEAFIRTLHKDYKNKSVSLIGDTGQYILLGGIDEKGKNVENELTFMLLSLITSVKLPDPKLILRVNKNTSIQIWKAATECIFTGCGSPLIMNEVPIMNQMVKFGYKEEDVWNVGTSACWEPLIIGKSFDQNNPFNSIVAAEALNDVLCGNLKITNFDDLMTSFKEVLASYIHSTISDLNFDCSPLFTLFFDSCIAREKDYTQKGADYSYHGAQILSLPNTVNALLNIKELVFEKKILSLEDCRKAIISDYTDMEDIRQLCLSTKHKFGENDKDVIRLTNDIMTYIGNCVADVKCNGEKVKIGFSSPNYVFAATNSRASMDGRHAGTPYAVHISPISSSIGISEILDFASYLNYDNNRINGNVVDFIVPISYMKNRDKLICLLKDACEKGVFEIQLNVLDRKKLIDAKAHPENYKELIVRVWGFSAYFNELPEEFKDNLIQRAYLYEGGENNTNTERLCI